MAKTSPARPKVAIACRGGAVPEKSTVCFAAKFTLDSQLFNPLPPPAGGRGKGEGGQSEVVWGAAHLTLPGAAAPGPLPLPPKGRRGAISGQILK